MNSEGHCLIMERESLAHSLLKIFKLNILSNKHENRRESRQFHVTDCCKHNNEPSGLIQSGEFHEKLHDY
jgi:hypothetical protein